MAATEGYKPLVKIPGMQTNATLTSYLSGLYNFLISIVGVLAMAVIVYGGMRYVVSAGNPAAMEDAKEAIWAAVYGLALALGSWLIINIVNPDMLVLKNPGVGLAPGKYSAAGNTNVCVGRPNSDAFSTIPYDAKDSGTYCTCIDGKNIPKKTKKAKLTLAPIPSTVTTGGSVALTFTLTDESSSSPLSGKTVKYNHVSEALNGMTYYNGGSTDGSGVYTINTQFNCLTSKIKVFGVFYGDAEYVSAVSDIREIALTAGSNYALNTPCTASDFPIPIVFGLPNTCNSLCSSKDLSPDRQFHCINANLGIGTTQANASDGNTIINGANAVQHSVDKDHLIQPVYFDAVSHSNILDNPMIAKIEINVATSWWTDTISADYTYVFDTACGDNLGPVLRAGSYHDYIKSWDDLTLQADNLSAPIGKFAFYPPVAKSYTPQLKVYPKDGCSPVTAPQVILEAK